ncbi:MAG: Translation initiation factor 2 [Candidatus Ozemobacter sibiricus]|uniref:Translation initiation factor 2 n=1 Tax=Candidatus Ozemobacter sibiricus TaxID=2268124 RepID=A0A367ZMU5_9BACT|nr:MAG: Translation initiation factor 2 [Candidatus Ozemobacter sibiricus]
MTSSSLDPTWLVDLQAPVKSFRLFALERAMAMPPSAELLAALEAHHAVEDDEECQLLLIHAIASIRQQLEGTAPAGPLPAPAAAGPADDPAAAFRQAWQAADLQGRLGLLNRLDARHRRMLAAQAPDLLAAEAHPVLQAALIRTFSRAWPADRIADLGRHLFEPSLAVRLAALEALSHLAPQSLVRDFPKLLRSPDPRLRALAIRGLAALDLDEAMLHLQALLNSPDRHDRAAGLQNCLLLPFPAVQPLLLDFLAAEPHPTLLRQAGDILVSNPDPQTPYRLWEAVERAPREKAPHLKQILEEVVAMLDKSRVLGDDFPRYLERLQSWIRQRAAVRFVQECLNRLTLQEGQSDDELDGIVRARLAQPAIRAAFTEALSWQVAPALKQVIRVWLEAEHAPASPAGAAVEPPSAPPVGPAPPMSPAPPPAPTATHGEDAGPSGSRPPGPEPADRGAIAQATTAPPATSASPATPGDDRRPADPALGAPPRPSPATAATVGAPTPTVPPSTAPPTSVPAAAAPPWESLSLTERIRRIGLWQEADRQEALARLGPFLNDAATPPEGRAAGLRAAARLGLPGFLDLARRSLKQSDGNLSSAALEYLGALDPDQVFPTLGLYLHAREPRLKNAALRILKRFDPRQALSTFQLMLKGRSREEQMQALACAIHFDFALIRETLTQFLIGQADQGILEAGIYLFQSNPEPENLYSLYRIERSLSGERAALVRNTRLQCQTFLVQSGLLSAAGAAVMDQELEARWSRDQARAAGPRPAYAYVAPETSPPLAERLAATWLALRDRYLTPARLVTALVLIVAGGTWLLWPAGPESIGRGPRLGAVSSEELTLAAVVSENDSTSGRLVLRDDQGREYLLFPRQDGVPAWPTGTRVEAVLVPFRVTSTNRIRAHARRLVKLE